MLSGAVAIQRARKRAEGRRAAPAKRQAPKPPPKEIFGPLGANSNTLAPQRKAAQRKVQRAEAALPKRPTPALPKLANPTARQVAAAVDLERRAQTKAVNATGTSGAARLEAGRAYRRELRNDPKQAQYVEATDRFKRIASRALAASVGRRAPGGRALSRAEAIAIGLRAIHAHRPDTVVPGRPDKKLGFGGLATINLTAAGRLATSAPGLQGGDLGPRQFVRHALGDVGLLGTAPFVGGYAIGDAGVSAAKGDTRKAVALGKGIVQGVKESAPGELAQGHPSKAGDAFLKHPLLETINVAAGIGTAGRVAGAVARGAGSDVAASGVRGALARSGSTVRPPLAMVDEPGSAQAGLVKERTYSKDSTRKAAQKAADSLLEPLRDTDGNVVTVKQRGREVPVLKPSQRQMDKLQEKRADVDAGRANAVERQARDSARIEDHTAGRVARGIKGRRANDLVDAVVDGTLRSPATLKADLTKRAAHIREQLKSPERYRTKAEFKAAEHRAEVFERAASDPKVLAKADRLFEVGHREAALLNKGDEAAIAAHIIDPKTAKRSALTTYAQAHMGARHVTVEEHAALEKELLKHEEVARSAVENATTAELPAARAALKRVRDARLAVSGKDPREVARREHVEGAHGRAAARLRKAAAAVARAERHKRDVTVKHRSQRARDRAAGARMTKKDRVAGRALVRREAERQGTAAQHKQRVTDARAELKAAREEHSLAKAALASTPKAEARAAIRHPDGRRLTDEEIEAHARAAGRDPSTLAYLPHRADADLRSSNHAAFDPGSRPRLDRGETRTGALYERGGNVGGRDLVRDELARKATQTAKAQQLDRLIAETGLRHPAWAKAQKGRELTKAEKKIVDGGGYLTAKEAREIAERSFRDGGQRLVPVTAFQAKLSEGTQAALRHEQAPAAMDSISTSLFNDRLNVKGGARNVVLVPEAYATRLAKHLESGGEINKLFQLLNGPFRMAVLPQPRWLTGNFFEPFIVRLPMSGAGINLPGMAMDVAAARKGLKALENGSSAERAAAREIRAQQLGGLFVGRKGASNRRTFEDFTGNTRAALYAAHVLRNLPVAKQLGDLVLTLPHLFFRVNRVIEQAAQHGALGKSFRDDVQAFTGSWLKTVKLTDEVLKDLKKGAVKASTQERWIKQQHEMLGQYESFSPGLRRAIQGPMPFLPWMLSAARFVYLTMPLHHTGAEALLLNAANVVQEEWDAAHANTPPGTLRLAQITKKGGLVDIARYSPYGLSGALSEGDFAELTGALLPQASGVKAALEGKDPFGRDLEVEPTADNPEGKATGTDKVKVAANALLGAMLPMLSLGQRIREGGATGYADSTILNPKTKPGTKHMSGVRRALDPFRPTYLKAPVVPSSAAADEGSVAPESGPDARLMRAAEREAAGGLSPAQMDMLERAALRAGG